MKYPLSREAAEELVAIFESACHSHRACLQRWNDVNRETSYKLRRAELLDALTGYCSHEKD